MKNKLTGEQRAVYPFEFGVMPEDGESYPLSWFDGVYWHGVVVDKVTGIAFTTHNPPDDSPIPRQRLAELFDDGFEP